MMTEYIVRQTWWPYPNVLALALSASIFGIVLGFVQMIACWPLRERGFAWPAASGFGVLLGVFVSLLGPFGQTAFGNYLLMLITGIAYGWASGIAIVYRIDEATGAEARRSSSL